MDIGADEKKAFKALSAACEHCREKEPDKKQKMQICARCKTIGRNMPYCSRSALRTYGVYFFKSSSRSLENALKPTGRATKSSVESRSQ
jgi:hypothetical protein